MYYSTYHPNAWACVWGGYHPEYIAKDNYSSSRLGTKSGKISGTYGKTMETATVLEGDITGDTVTFGFYSPNNNSTSNYGFVR